MARYMGFGLKRANTLAKFFLVEHQKVSTFNTDTHTHTVRYTQSGTTQSQWSLTGGAGSPIWFIRAGAHKTVGLGEAEVSAAAIIYSAQVGT